MKVKAKWSVKDASGWHDAGEVFETESDLGDAVEVLEAPKKQKAEKKPAEPVKEPEPKAKAEEDLGAPADAPEDGTESKDDPEPEPEVVKPRSATRRKVGTSK